MIPPQALRLKATFPLELNHQNSSQLEISVNQDSRMHPSSLFTGQLDSSGTASSFWLPLKSPILSVLQRNPDTKLSYQDIGDTQ